jgi:hypothetical protein
MKGHKLDMAINALAANVRAAEEDSDSHPILAVELDRRVKSFRAALRVLRRVRAEDKRRSKESKR